MSADQRFGLILTSLSLLFTVMCVLLGLIYRNGVRVGETNGEIKSLIESIKSVSANLDKHIDWHLSRERK